VTYNHAEQVGELRRAAAAVPGLGEARDVAPSMGAEDFAFFTERLPGAYLWLGGRDEAHHAPLHSCRFDFNDHSLALGVALWLRLVRDLLPPPSANS
jgi:metal-dependent amidase/aminoacylase/carboxypeptidase family protein